MAAASVELPDDLAELKRIVVSLQADLQEKDSELSAKILELTRKDEIIALLKKELFGRSSERFNPEEFRQAILFNEAEAHASDEPPPRRSKVRQHSRSRRKPGRKALPANLPRETVLHEVPESERAGRVYIGDDACEYLTIVPERVFVERHVYPKYAFPEGIEYEGQPAVLCAPREARLIPGGIISAGLAAWLFTAKFCDHLPFFRIEKIFKRWGVDLSRATMCNTAIAVADKCARLVELMLEDLRAGDLVASDETTLQVLNSHAADGAKNTFMFVLRGGQPDNPIVIFKHRPTRHAGFLKELLQGFKGALITDGFDGYDAVARELHIEHAGCWDHARRKFVELSKASSGSPAAKAALKLIGRLYASEREARNKGLTAEELLEVRNKMSRRRLEYLKRWIDKQSLGAAPKSLLGQALGYMRNQWPKLVCFISNPAIPISNILAENAIRPFVIGRKNWIFSASFRGALASAILYTLIETARANSLEPYWYLRYLFDRLPNAKCDDDLHPLLPNKISMDQIRAAYPNDLKA